MQRTVSLKLVNPPDAALAATVEAYRAACQTVSLAIVTGERLNARSLQTTHYAALRRGLPAQMAVSVTRSVVGAWKSWRSNGAEGKPPTFKRPVACYQVNRDWSLKPDDIVSFRVLHHRVKLQYQTNPLGHERLRVGKVGGARLVKKRRGWFLDVSVELPTPVTSYAPITPVGVDQGMKNLVAARAPNASPLLVRGGRVQHHRMLMRRTRARLQVKDTPSAKRVLRNLSRREQRFVLDQARCAAKAVVRYAQRFDRPIIVLEDLEGIRDTAKARGPQGRARLHSWAYCVSAQTIRDRAEEVGIPIAFVDAAYTSRTCPACGDAGRENRRGLNYACQHCGWRNHADVTGATNIQRRWKAAMADLPRGPVNGPNECRIDGRLDHAPPDLTLKPPASAGGS